MAFRNDQVTGEETERIVRLAREALKLPGDYVEMGCYKGDTSLLLAEIIFSGPRRSRPFASDVPSSAIRVPRGERPRGSRANSRAAALRNAQKKQSSANEHRLFIYDSFEGLPKKTAEDESVLGENFKEGELLVSKREVKERFLRAGLPVPVIRKGWFSELKEEDMPEKIAFAFLDGDFYESIRDSLRLVLPRMVEDGILVVHDYTNPALPGVKKAVDEFLGLTEVKVVLL